MSNEIKASINYNIQNGNYSDSFQVSGSFNQLAQGASAGVLATSTSPVSLPVGSLGTVGILLVRNLDSSNNIQIGNYVSSTFQAFALLKPGEPGVIRIDPAATIKVQSVSGTPLLQYLWLSS